MIKMETKPTLPILTRKRKKVEAYVAEKVKKMEMARNAESSIDYGRKNSSFNGSKKYLQQHLRQIHKSQPKKNIIFSPNKVISNQRLISSFEPFRKEIAILRSRPEAKTINYEQLFSNLQPYHNLREIVAEKHRRSAHKSKRKYSQMPSNANLYSSIPKKQQLQPISEANINKEGFFLNVQRINLDDKSASLKKFQQYYSSFQIPKDYKQMATVDLVSKKRVNGEGLKVIMVSNQLQSEAQESIINLEDEESSFLTTNPKKHEKNSKQYKNNSSLPVPKRWKSSFNIPFQTYYYRDLLWKLNYSNRLLVETPHEYEHRLKMYVGKGNNSALVRGFLKRRIWFAYTDRLEDANFAWTQLKCLTFFKLQPEGRQNSPELQYSQKQYCPNSLLLDSDKKQIKNYLKNYSSVEERSDERLLPRGKQFKFQNKVKINEVKQGKMHNHLLNNYVIGNKKALLQTMASYFSSIGKQVFDFLPLTFHIKGGLQDPSYFKFLKYFYKQNKEIKKINEEKGKVIQHNAWIVKPGQNSNRGNGIKVCFTLEEIKQIIKKREKYQDGSERTYIIQKYIAHPLLYHRRKFDLRHYLLITCINGYIKGYWYEEGYVRTTSSEYTLKNSGGKIHLTNDSVQKNLPDYGKYQKGNKISYDDLDNYISKHCKKNTKKVGFKDVLLPKMKELGTDIVKACSGIIDPQRRTNNFQLFGLDFMIDDNFKLYLIEVNSNPCLEISCPLLGGIIPRMLQNTLELTLDTQFPPPVRYYPKGVHYFKKLEEWNKFSLVFDSRIQKVYSCMENLDDKLLEEEDDTFEDDGEEFQFDED